MALSLDESAQLMQDAQFRGRVKVACMNYAQRILAGGSFSQAAFRWASQTYQSPDAAAQSVTGPTVMEPGVQDQGGAIDDGGLQFAVENAVNKML